jgi:hypothetical protein
MLCALLAEFNLSMLRNLPIFLVLAIAGLLCTRGLCAGEEEGTDNTSGLLRSIGGTPKRRPAANRMRFAPSDDDEAPRLPAETEESSEMDEPKSVPQVEAPIPGLDLDGAAGAPIAVGVPERWLDQNDQFLSEGDPYPPGQDPFREWAGIGPGWFAGAEVTATSSEVHSEVSSNNLQPGDPFTGTFTQPIRLPVAELNWTAMPRIFVGYRSENGLGEVILGYRYMQSQGSGSIPNFDAAGTGQLSSRLQVHVLDLDYAFTDRLDGLSWIFPKIVRRSIGMRTTSAIFDSTANGGQILEENAGNVFIGAGPRFNIEGTWTTRDPAIGFFMGTDVSGILGFDYQRFGEQIQTAGGIHRASGRTDGTLSGIPILNVRAGLSWIPDWKDGAFRFSAGYQWEQWWITSDTFQTNEINLQGPFVRGEYRW